MASQYIVSRLPRKVRKLQFVSIGAISFVYRLTDSIVIKVPRDLDAPELDRENAIYDILEQHPPCPYVMQSFYRTPIANFLPSMVGSLDTRLRGNQRPDKNTVLEVLRVEDTGLVERWTAELCVAVAWLGSLGIVHGDLRPPNLLLIILDERDHLKLTDFDCVERIRDRSSGNAPPWARLYPDPVTGHGHYGVNGPKTEQFSIGSLIYCMTRGHEPYEEPGKEDLGTKVVDLFKKGIFLPVDAEGSALDCIIDRCWNGSYETVKDLADAARLLPGAADMGDVTTFSANYCAEVCRVLSAD